MKENLYAKNKDTLLALEKKSFLLRGFLHEISYIEENINIEIISPTKGIVLLEISKQEDEDLYRLLEYKISQKIIQQYKEIQSLVSSISF